jgi:hypothetical protein
MKQLWIVSNRQRNGTPFIANDQEDELGDTYVTIDKDHPNMFGVVCCINGVTIINGWENVDNQSYSYCDEHVEIMN